MKSILLISWMFAPLLMGGSFTGAVGTPDCEAIHKDSTSFVAWATGNLPPAYGADVETSWMTPEKAYGKATDDTHDIVCLGNGGSITMTFAQPIRDDVGADFAVFENGISAGFLELAFVEVSSDGVHFFRFPNRSEGESERGPFSSNMNPTTINGLAGKYQKGYGTPFDLSNLPPDPLLDREHIRFVRIVDIVGDGSMYDSIGHEIYDPTPTEGSGGFDLEAIGVIHQGTEDVINPLLNYQAWADNAAQGLAAGVDRAPMSDPDGDGISNLLEFVLGGVPMIASRAILPQLLHIGGAWLFEYDRSDLSLLATVQVVEYGSDLKGWSALNIPETSSGLVEIIDGSPALYDHVRVTIPNPGGGQIFARFKVTKP